MGIKEKIQYTADKRVVTLFKEGKFYKCCNEYVMVFAQRVRAYKVIIFVLLFFCTSAYSQNIITGTFPNPANQKVKLTGFSGFDTCLIDSIQANEKGVFELSYSKTDYGMGYLSTADNKHFFVVLGGETIRLKGESFAIAESIEIIEGHENKIFAQYATEHPRREQALSAWGYLEKIYLKNSLFTVQETPKQAIANEKQRIKAEDSLFLAGLDAQISFWQIFTILQFYYFLI